MMDFGYIVKKIICSHCNGCGVCPFDTYTGCDDSYRGMGIEEQIERYSETLHDYFKEGFGEKKCVTNYIKGRLMKTTQRGLFFAHKEYQKYASVLLKCCDKSTKEIKPFTVE